VAGEAQRAVGAPEVPPGLPRGEEQTHPSLRLELIPVPKESRWECWKNGFGLPESTGVGSGDERWSCFASGSYSACSLVAGGLTVR